MQDTTSSTLTADELPQQFQTLVIAEHTPPQDQDTPMTDNDDEPDENPELLSPCIPRTPTDRVPDQHDDKLLDIYAPDTIITHISGIPLLMHHAHSTARASLLDQTDGLFATHQRGEIHLCYPCNFRVGKCPYWHRTGAVPQTAKRRIRNQPASAVTARKLWRKRGRKTRRVQAKNSARNQERAGEK